MKDVFVDTNVAKNFTNPMDPAYKEFVRWLHMHNEAFPENSAWLAVSNKLIAEYNRSCGPTSNIIGIIDRMTREGRLNRISNELIKEFQRAYFSRTIEKKLKSNDEDRHHIPVVLLSNRKIAITLDRKLRDDLHNFPGHLAKAVARPDEIDYR
jgi:hypothetical protein